MRLTEQEQRRQDDIAALDVVFNGTPDLAQVSRALLSGLIENERDTVQIIKRWLLTEEQRRELFNHDLSIQDLLGGHFTGYEEGFVQSTFNQWNALLGVVCFSFQGSDLGKPYPPIKEDQ